MKNKLFKSFFILLLMLSMIFAYGQEEKKMPTMYSIHLDPVKPSMYQEYEKLSKEFIALLKENDVKDFDFLTSVSQEFNYYYISSVDKMADFDKSPMAGLSEEAQGKLKSLFDGMDKCYDRHGTYMLYLDKELTYMPEEFSIATPGEPYRVYYTHHYDPANGDAIYEAFKNVKNQLQSKQSTWNYRVYHSGFGVVGNYILVAFSAKDAMDFEAKHKANWELMGDEFGEAINQLFKYTSRFEVERAWMREDLSYKN
jgi:hypothetical protein